MPEFEPWTLAEAACQGETTLPKVGFLTYHLKMAELSSFATGYSRGVLDFFFFFAASIIKGEAV